jgi:signal peptidase I
MDPTGSDRDPPPGPPYPSPSRSPEPIGGWKDRVWYIFWYFLLPAGLAVAAVQGLANVGALEEAAPWQYLLAFAVLEVVVLAIRDRVLGSRRQSGPRDLRTVASEARELQREAERLIKRGKPSGEARAEIEKAIAGIDESISKRNADATVDGIRRLDELLDKHLGRVRKGTTREYIEAIAFAVLVALGIRAFVIEAFKIPSPSMYPTLYEGDNKFVYGPLIPFTNRRLFQGRTPHRGEVVVFIYPQDPSKDYIKRIVGLEGDKIRVFADGSIEVNGQMLSRCEIGTWAGDSGGGEPSGPRRLDIEWHGDFSYLTLHRCDGAELIDRGRYAVSQSYTVPPGHAFVMGDNRDNSYDSRFWGPVPLQNIKGRALWIWWSNLGGAGCGMRWGRFGQNILGTPGVPPQAPHLIEGYNSCLHRGREGNRPVRPQE